MIDLVQKICRTYARPTNHPGGALSYLFILFFLPICRPAEASNQELFAIKKCRFAAALKLFVKKKNYSVTTNLKPLPCMFTISSAGSSFKYLRSLAIYTSILRPLK